jgi:hypothetical protein
MISRQRILRAGITALALSGLFTATAAQAAELPPAGSLSLLGDRFRVEASWRTAEGGSGTGYPVSLTSETGYFWFFSPQNAEVVVKTLDACSSSSPRFWVFAAGLTDAAVDLTVTDQLTGQQKTYRNAQGHPFEPIQDTDAFATCGVQRCGQGSQPELAATPRGDLNAETLALILGGGLTAPQGLYARVAGDLAAIHLLRPDLDLTFPPPFDPQTLFVNFSLDTATAVEAGTYHAWDCLNSWYKASRVDGPYPGGTYVLHFDSVLDLRQVVTDYQALPGVGSVEVIYGGFGIPIPTVLLPSTCGLVRGSRHHYFVRVPPSGTLYYFYSEPGQPAVYGGSTTGDASAWLELSQQCFGIVSLY